jgi:cyanate permease
MLHRELFGTYTLVFGSALTGLLIGVFVVDVEPAVIGWVFGMGSGLMLGAFVAAVASNEPLVGRGALPREPVLRPPGADDERAEAGNGR